MRITRLLIVIVMIVPMLGGVAACGDDPAPSPGAPVTLDQVIDRLIQREHENVQELRKYDPIVETYAQVMRPDKDQGAVPVKDNYFLAKLDTTDRLYETFYTDYETREGLLKTIFGSGHFQTAKSPFKRDVKLMPLGFSSMVFLDRDAFDRQHYDFKFLRREFLGELRCMLFQVTPRESAGVARFSGRIWVEDQDYNIVRFNGTYASQRGKQVFHMDSWRQNLRPDVWMPSHVYVEESDIKGQKGVRFKAQTRLWGYDLRGAGRQEEFTDVRVDSLTPVQDTAASTTPLSPVLSVREWQREAEENVLEHLEKAGLLAMRGDVDKVLETVVSNIEITNNLNIEPEIHCRVLLTTPLETFTVGHTIVISRGMLDVLPDESSLAMILARELARIALGDQIDTKWAFGDRVAIPDEKTFLQYRFNRQMASDTAADAKALDLLRSSPYRDKLSSPGLFLRALASRSAALTALTQPHMGNSLTDRGRLTRMVELMSSAPELRVRKLDQIAALPLNGRIKLNAWDDTIELIKAQPVPLLSAKEKMPFEVTPIFLNLTRVKNPGSNESRSTGQ
jgi:hypothetical protein